MTGMKDGERFQPSVDALNELIDSLPVRVSLVSDYSRVGHIAHGWFQRCVRGVRAVLALQGAGYGGEASPIVRSVVEHLVALGWLVAHGSAILGPIKRAHGKSAAQLFEEWRAAQDIDPGTDQLAAILASVSGTEDLTFDTLLHHKHRAEHWATATDRVMYQGEVMRSHPTFQSASAYYDFDKRETLLVGKESADHRHFAAAYLFRAARTFDAILLGSPWAEDLNEIEEQLRELSADLALPDW